MSYISGKSRDQLVLFTETLDNRIPDDSIARVIDAFVDQLDLAALGFHRARPSDIGRPPYDPADLLRLYLYGYANKIHSSRKLEAETHRNIEVLWLMRELHPDFKTIADFRRDNPKPIKAVFKKFVLFLKQIDLIGGRVLAVDGTKLAAVNNPSKATTQKRLATLLTEADTVIKAYLDAIEKADTEEFEAPSVADARFQELLKLLRNRKNLEQLHKIIETLPSNQQEASSQAQNQTGTEGEAHGRAREQDKEERLAVRDGNVPDKTAEPPRDQTSPLESEEEREAGAGPCSNDTAADNAEPVHSPENGSVSEQGTDRQGSEIPGESAQDTGHGNHAELAGKKEKETSRLEKAQAMRSLIISLREKMTAKGYEQLLETDPEARLIKPAGKSAIAGYNVQSVVDSEHKMIVDILALARVNDRGLLAPMMKRAAQLLDLDKFEALADKGYHTNEDILACVRGGITPLVPSADSSPNSKKGYFRKSDFVYDKVLNAYRCPAGALLEPKPKKKDKDYEMYSTKRCVDCPLRKMCTDAERGRRIKRWRHEDVLEEAQAALKARPEAMKLRKGMVEHPFGYIKKSLNYTQFLTKGLEKVNAEASLLAWGFNVKRAIKAIGGKKLVKLIREKGKHAGIWALELCYGLVTLLARRIGPMFEDSSTTRFPGSFCVGKLVAA